MAVALHTTKDSFEIGSSSLLNALFSTIFVRLERENWGSVYPVIMRQLYSGELPNASIQSAREELKRIEENLKSFSPDDVVWDFENRTKTPPWGKKISPNITTLANYFWTSDGEPLFAVLRKAFDAAEAQKSNITIR